MKGTTVGDTQQVGIAGVGQRPRRTGLMPWDAHTVDLVVAAKVAAEPLGSMTGARARAAGRPPATARWRP